MMNDIRALCSVNNPGLVQFIGAYHAPENGQVHASRPDLACMIISGPARLPGWSRPTHGDGTQVLRGDSGVHIMGRSPSCWST